MLTWIGRELGTSTRGLSRWLRGRGHWQVPQWGEISSAWGGRGRREFVAITATWRRGWTAAAHPIVATVHGRKRLIHIRRGTSCNSRTMRYTCHLHKIKSYPWNPCCPGRNRQGAPEGNWAGNRSRGEKEACRGAQNSRNLRLSRGNPGGRLFRVGKSLDRPSCRSSFASFASLCFVCFETKPGMTVIFYKCKFPFEMFLTAFP